MAARQIVFGLHVHVGVSSGAKAVACANGLRNELPEPLWRRLKKLTVRD